MSAADRAPLRVGMVGYGFMGAIHAQAWRTAGHFFDLPRTPELTAIAGRHESAVLEAQERYGALSATTRWQDLVEDSRIDVIDICSPGDTHREVAIAALDAGKHVLCEKPLANSVADAETMVEAAEEAERHGVRSMCGFSYRRTPALAYARRLVAEGAIGTVRQIRADYLQDWLSDESAPMTWRLEKDKAGSGALGDIGAHIVDLAQWIGGSPVAAVSGMLQTLVPERPVEGADGELRQVTVDDAALFSARFANGAIGAFEATRMATGRKNALRIELNGSTGSLAFDFERLNELQVYDATAPAGRRGFTRILTTEPEHPYADHWWPTGHGLGYEHTFTHEVADFVAAIGEDRSPSPSFRDALGIQRVLEAVERSSAADGAWQQLPLPADPAPSSPASETSRKDTDA